MLHTTSKCKNLVIYHLKKNYSNVSRDSKTYSLVSRVIMMRMGLLFMPPTQLLLHMKLYRMVVNSVPTYNTRKS